MEEQQQMSGHELEPDKLIVLCTDLDRTLIPNGSQPESPAGRRLFKQIVERPEVILVYVSGRDQGLVEDAIDVFDLPVPDFVVGDVGTSIYRVQDGNWQNIESWYEKISCDWQGKQWWELAQAIGEINGLELQAEQKQNRCKLSYQVEPAKKAVEILPILKQKLNNIAVRYQCIHSVDETQDLALVDVLPQSASKRLAIDFLASYLDVSKWQIFFSGDSGNDLDVLVSSYCSTLVANATEEVKRQAIERCQSVGVIDSLYIATGISENLNGNYAAGIIEGLVHFFPQTKNWINYS